MKINNNLVFMKGETTMKRFTMILITVMTLMVMATITTKAITVAESNVQYVVAEAQKNIIHAIKDYEEDDEDILPMEFIGIEYSEIAEGVYLITAQFTYDKDEINLCITYDGYEDEFANTGWFSVNGERVIDLDEFYETYSGMDIID